MGISFLGESEGNRNMRFCQSFENTDIRLRIINGGSSKLRSCISREVTVKPPCMDALTEFLWKYLVGNYETVRY